MPSPSIEKRNQKIGCGCCSVFLVILFAVFLFSILSGGDDDASGADATPTASEEELQDWADEIEEASLMGFDSWHDAADGDHANGIWWINGMSADSIGTLHVTLQLHGVDDESKYLAEAAANWIFTSAGPDHDELSRVIVEGTDGVIINHKQRSDYPALD